MEKWENTYFGKEGRFFPAVYLVPVPVLAMALFLLFFSSADGFHIWERIILVIIGAMFLIYSYQGLEAVAIFQSTIREVSTIEEGILCLKTFGGKTIVGSQITSLREDRVLYKKKNTKFLFPDQPRSLVLQLDSEKYFLPSSISNFDSLRNRIRLTVEDETEC